VFVDEVHIAVQAGKGGDGCVSFRRERHQPRGGPDGGNGGDGGSVLMRASRDAGNLMELRKTRVYAAKNGEPGKGRNRAGASAEDLVIEVPCGTIVRNGSGELVVDLTDDGQTAVVARGGRGGRGNRTFATPTHQTPREYTPGEPGEERELDLELRLIADVGLVGLPNAGKSTLLARVTAARPKVASYPFTTLTPQLGFVTVDRFAGFVMADIPGLIEGAADGAGLGHEFLRHIERTRLLAHVVDLAPVDGSDPVENVRTLSGELERFSPELASRPTLLVGNKTDLPDAETNATRLREAFDAEVLCVSACSGDGVERFVQAAFERLQDLGPEPTDAREENG
jgi:GTP-binding protein